MVSGSALSFVIAIVLIRSKDHLVHTSRNNVLLVKEIVNENAVKFGQPSFNFQLNLLLSLKKRVPTTVVVKEDISPTRNRCGSRIFKTARL